MWNRGIRYACFLLLEPSGKSAYIFVDPSLAESCTGYLGGDEGTKKQLKDIKIILTIIHVRK